MGTTLILAIRGSAAASPLRHLLRSACAALFASLLSLLLTGCAVHWVSAYDKESADRTTEISKSVLKLYQDLLTTPAARRKTAVAGEMGQRHADVETMIRIHLLKEQGRAKNDEGAKIAENLLESWLKFSASHRSDDSTALTDATLNAERTILERHLRSAFTAEEARKLVSLSR